MINVSEKFNNSTIFESLGYDASSIHCEKLDAATVTRVGVCFKGLLPVSKSFYQYPYAAVRTIAIAYASLAKRETKRIPSSHRPIGVIHSIWTAGYYHWVTESLPRLLSLKKEYPDCLIILPKSSKNYNIFGEFVEILTGEKPEYFPDESNISHSNVILASCPPKMAVLSDNYYCEVRDACLAAEGSNMKAKRKLYITRKKSRGRRIINEAEVFEYLRFHGFEEVAFEDFSVREQIRISSESVAMVSIHGAGLTNMMFMPQGGSILELVPRKRSFLREFNLVRMSSRHDPCYVRLASSLGHKYSVLECEPIDSSRRTSHMDDIFVDLDLLKVALAG